MTPDGSNGKRLEKRYCVAVAGLSAWSAVTLAWWLGWIPVPAPRILLEALFWVMVILVLYGAISWLAVHTEKDSEAGNDGTGEEE